MPSWTKAARQCEEKNWEYLHIPCAGWALGRSREQSGSRTGHTGSGRGVFFIQTLFKEGTRDAQPALCQLEDMDQPVPQGFGQEHHREATGWVCFITDLEDFPRAETEVDALWMIKERFPKSSGALWGAQAGLQSGTVFNWGLNPRFWVVGMVSGQV